MIRKPKPSPLTTLYKPGFWGLHALHLTQHDTNNVADGKWPQVPFDWLRLWDVGDYTMVPTRATVSWVTVSPNRGTRDWVLLDRYIDIMRRRNMKAMYAHGYVPWWASARTCTVTPSASPTTVTLTGHGLTTGWTGRFYTTGTLPSGIVADTSYTLTSTGANTFTVPVTTTTAGTGTLSFGVASANPTNVSEWEDWVATLCTRYKDTIRIWGSMNEPNSTTFWRGTTAELVDLQKRLYTIVKSIDPTCLVTSPEYQGNGSGTFASFCSAGGTPYFDVVAAHLYGYPDNRLATSSGIIQIITGYRTQMATLGISSRPFWNTEWSQNAGGGPFDATGAIHLAKMYTLAKAYGMGAMAPYAYEAGTSGSIMWTEPAGPFTDVKTAYDQVYDWLNGAYMPALGMTLTPNSVGVPGSGGATKFQSPAITRRGGYEAFVIWDTAASTLSGIDAKYTRYRGIASSTPTTISGNSIVLSNSPIIVETGAPP